MPDLDRLDTAQTAALMAVAHAYKERFAALDRNLTILTYCHVGSRSSGVLALADELGFKRVFDLRGGIAAWKSGGLPVAKGGAGS